jgi:hypothetical protein
MTTYLHAKITWLRGGEKGPEPPLDILVDVPAAPCATAEMVVATPRSSRNRRRQTN